MTSPHITIVTEDNFEEEVLKADKMVLIDFYADWCGPCKSMAPALEQYAQENQGSVKVVKINVDDCPNLAGMFQIKSIPTLVTMKDGQGIYGAVGTQPKSKIEEFVKESFKAVSCVPPAGDKMDPKGPTPKA